MRMIEIDYEAAPPIDSYGPGGFRIDGAWHAGSLILLPERLLPFSGDLTPEALQPVLVHGELDVVLMGMGADIAPAPQALRRAFDLAGLGVDVMSTASACRTYNVLLTEDRRVCAVLTAVSAAATSIP